MYGVEVWGCSRRLEPIGCSVAHSPSVLWGGHTLSQGIHHCYLKLGPYVLVAWEVKMRCVRFWLKVSTSDVQGEVAKEVSKTGSGEWQGSMGKECG